MYILADLEADSLRPTKIHCICIQEYPDGEPLLFTNMAFFREWVRYHKGKIKKWFFHNGLSYDGPVISRLLGEDLIDPQDIVDTMVVSKLVNYTAYRTHSLDEIGTSLGMPKTEYTGGWEKYTDEMGEYCKDDVKVLKEIVKDQWKYITDPEWWDSMRLEHDTAILCQEMSEEGFEFDVPKAESLLKNITDEMEVLEDSFKASFGSKLKPVKTLKLRKKADGSLFKGLQEAIDSYPKVEIDEDTEEITVYDHSEFNPGSPKQRIDALWDAGWKPTEKTDGYLKAIRKARRSR